MNKDTPPPSHRLIVSTDAANEADDQFAIAQALLTPTLDIRGVVAAHFGRVGNLARIFGHCLQEVPVPTGGR